MDHSSTTNGSMTASFLCPIYQNEVDRNEPHEKCMTGRVFPNMAALRKHMTYETKEYPRHLSFVEQCKNCKHDFIDEAVSSQEHGKNCKSKHRTVLKGEKAKEHYQAFNKMVLAHVAGEHVISTGKSMINLPTVIKLTPLQEDPSETNHDAFEAVQSTVPTERPKAAHTKSPHPRHTETQNAEHTSESTDPSANANVRSEDFTNVRFRVLVD